ncbi:MAG: response regulator transcription factor [Candidatus Nomurabacteria bacterium]|jgi:DNA-binding response OmpR family regulator|nr:response regulator transcription factor [Candidatus Nomurabacteria bacterium]
MRVLIIEDNERLAGQVAASLKQAGKSVDLAKTAADGEYKLGLNQYDVMLLDLNLPDKNGLDLLKELRAADNRTPVIIITAWGEVEQRTAGLDAGADDYITKPFSLAELAARIDAVVRRYDGFAESKIKVGKLEIRPRERAAEYDGRTLGLRAKEFDILEYLAAKAPAVVSQEELAEHVYNEAFDPFSSVLRVHLANIRKALIKADARPEDVLETLRGKGYRVCGARTASDTRSR